MVSFFIYRRAPQKLDDCEESEESEAEKQTEKGLADAPAAPTFPAGTCTSSTTFEALSGKLLPVSIIYEHVHVYVCYRN